MATITVKYFLDEAGKKAHLLAGKEVKDTQIYEVDQEFAGWPDAVELSKVENEQLVVWLEDRLSVVPDDEFLAGELSKQRVNRDQERSERELQLKEDKANFQLLVDSRATETCLFGSDETEVEYEAPVHAIRKCYDPWGGAQEWQRKIVNQPAAAEWIREMEQVKVSAKAKHEKLVQEKKERYEAELLARKQEKERNDNEFRTANDLPDGSVWFFVEQGCMIEVPCYESHRRGKNWLAIVSKNPSAPGGLDRDFQEKCRGEYYYSVSGLSVGDYVEFGADYYSGGGRRRPERWYGKVIKIAEDFVAFEPDCKP